MKSTDIRFLAKACGGRLSGNSSLQVSGVKIDSRACGSGDLFICIKGERSNGHSFAGAAYDQGCRAFLVTEDIEEREGAAYIHVEDAYSAAAAMAAAYLAQFNVIKIGITGSVGKTTTKELTAAVMSAKYKTVYTFRNLNANYGLCLTCFSVDDSTECVVFEEGMDRMHELSEAAQWLKLDLAIITNVGVSHMEILGSRDAIAYAKLEITEALSEDGVLVVNSLSDYLKTEEEIRAVAANKAPFRIVRVGSDICYKGFENLNDNGIRFYVNNTKFTLGLLGEHVAQDACLAVACGLQFGISEELAAKALAKIKPTERRLKADCERGITLLDDSYNASPESMKAGIAALLSVDAKRHIAVLSDMLELGPAEEEGHISVGCFAAEKGLDILIATGKKKEYYFKGAEGGSVKLLAAEDLEEAERLVKETLLPGDAVLVKGSNSTHVGRVAEYIRKEIFRSSEGPNEE